MKKYTEKTRIITEKLDITKLPFVSLTDKDINTKFDAVAKVFGLNFDKVSRDQYIKELKSLRDFKEKYPNTDKFTSDDISAEIYDDIDTKFVDLVNWWLFDIINEDDGNPEFDQEMIKAIVDELQKLGHDVDEGLLGALVGATAGPKIGKIIAGIIGAEEGKPLYNLLTSRAVTTALGYALKKK